MENMETTIVKLEICFKEEVINFNCNEVKNTAEINNNSSPLPSVSNNEQLTESDSVQENTISCLKDFDTVLNSGREQHIPINTSTSNVEENYVVEGSNLDTPCDDLDQASGYIETWQNIYEKFAQAYGNIYVDTTDDGPDEISQIDDNQTYIRNEMQIVTDKEMKVPTDLTEHKTQIVEIQQNHHNINTKVIENYYDLNEVYRDIENDTKIRRIKLYSDGESICKKVLYKSKQINKSTNSNTQKVVPWKSHNIRGEISISHNDENLRMNAKILKNKTPSFHDDENLKENVKILKNETPSFSHDDENLRENAKILQNEAPSFSHYYENLREDAQILNNETPFFYDDENLRKNAKILKNETPTFSHDYENLIKNAKNLKNETLDIISISSDESADNIDFDSDSYNSSDFEFINEIEAKKDIPQFDNYMKLFPTSDDIRQRELFPEDMIINDYFKSLETTNESDVRYRENHIIPSGEDYFNLFEGNHTPYPMYTFENKSTRPSAGMNVGRGVGFDMEMFIDDSTPEQRSEAKETERKILSMYYSENRHRRRR